jgi:SAM-dependent methyltransferase
VKTKLNVGCGTDIKPDYINLDVADLPGVDIAHDLTRFPWPFGDNSFEKIQLINVLEHLPDTISTLEELHRIARPDAKIIVRVPYWNSPDMLADPTHKRAFSERTLDFFDPACPECRDRPYYSRARFKIARKSCYIKFFFYLKISLPVLTGLLFFLARYLGAVVWVIEFELRVIKSQNA